jgi:hypothetical protein
MFDDDGIKKGRDGIEDSHIEAVGEEGWLG